VNLAWAKLMIKFIKILDFVQVRLEYIALLEEDAQRCSRIQSWSI
jgi:hypothetical protein